MQGQLRRASSSVARERHSDRWHALCVRRGMHTQQQTAQQHQQRPLVGRDLVWKSALADVHEHLRFELMRLESTAWKEARRLSQAETAQMMRTLQTLRIETLRHLGVADRLGAADDDAWRTHIGDQWTVEKAMEKAFLASHGKVTTSLQRVQGMLCRLFEVERACGPSSGLPMGRG